MLYNATNGNIKIDDTEMDYISFGYGKDNTGIFKVSVLFFCKTILLYI